jgi:hypothetical protein
MNANVFGGLTPRKRPRWRAVAALLPGVCAIVLAGVSGVAASASPAASPTPTPTPTASPSPTPLCHHHHHPLCATPTPSPTATPTPTPTPTATPTPTPTPTPTVGGGKGGGTGGSTGGSGPTPTPKPTAKPSGSSGASGGHSGGGTSSPAATRVQVPADPSPFASLTGAVASLGSGGLDAARIPPVEALTPLSGLDFGSGLNVGPLLLLIDLIGIGLLVYLVRTRWLAPEA